MLLDEANMVYFTTRRSEIGSGSLSYNSRSTAESIRVAESIDSSNVDSGPPTARPFLVGRPEYDLYGSVEAVSEDLGQESDNKIGKKEYLIKSVTT